MREDYAFSQRDSFFFIFFFQNVGKMWRHIWASIFSICKERHLHQQWPRHSHMYLITHTPRILLRNTQVMTQIVCLHSNTGRSSLYSCNKSPKPCHLNSLNISLLLWTRKKVSNVLTATPMGEFIPWMELGHFPYVLPCSSSGQNVLLSLEGPCTHGVQQ